jgi:hypothetical protein
VGQRRQLCICQHTGVWIIGDSLAKVQSELQRLADEFSAFTKRNGLALNGGETQLLVSSSVKKEELALLSIVVDGANVKPSDTLELLGVVFDRQFTPRPYLEKLAVAARFRASCVKRLAQNIPRGRLLCQLGNGLLLGKVRHALTVVAARRLPGLLNKPTKSLASVQVAINDVAGTVTGGRRKDHVTVKTLLERAKLPSVNWMVVKATAVQAWSAFVSKDGGDGFRNAIGRMIFDNPS